MMGQLRGFSSLQITCSTLLLKIIQWLFLQQNGGIDSFKFPPHVMTILAVTRNVLLQICGIIDSSIGPCLGGIPNKALKLVMKYILNIFANLLGVRVRVDISCMVEGAEVGTTTYGWQAFK